MNQSGFNLIPGMKVKVYNDPDKMGKRRSVIRPGVYEVIGFNNGKYTVKDNRGNTSVVPRFKITDI